jgi:hypothetical protein
MPSAAKDHPRTSNRDIAGRPTMPNNESNTARRGISDEKQKAKEKKDRVEMEKRDKGKDGHA